MTSEALQNPYFVRLYCKNIDKTHSLTEPNDKIQFHGNYFFKKKGGGTTLERGGEPTPWFPPPPKSALAGKQLHVEFLNYPKKVHFRLPVYKLISPGAYIQENMVLCNKI